VSKLARDSNSMCNEMPSGYLVGRGRVLSSRTSCSHGRCDLGRDLSLACEPTADLELAEIPDGDGASAPSDQPRSTGASAAVAGGSWLCQDALDPVDQRFVDKGRTTGTPEPPTSCSLDDGDVGHVGEIGFVGDVGDVGNVGGVGDVGDVGDASPRSDCCDPAFLSHLCLCWATPNPSE
jgi:hypothetical protein